LYREIAAALVAVVALALTLPDYPHRWLTLATLWLALVLSLAALKSDDSREVVLRPGKGAYAALVCLLLALALVPVEDKVTSLVAPWGNLGPTYWGRLLPVTLVTTLTPGYALLWGRVTELWEKVTLSIMLSINYGGERLPSPLRLSRDPRLA